MPLRSTTLALVILSTLAGCKERVDSAPGAASSAGGGAGGSAPTAKSSTPDFSPWDFAAIRGAFKGGLVFRFNGTYQAWEMNGDHGVIFDDVHGKTGEDTAVTFELEAPCRARVKYGDAKTGTASSNFEFTLKDGVFPGGSGGIGMKKGDELVFCEGTDVVYRFGKAGCAVWKVDGGKWTRREKAACGLEAVGGESFFWTELGSDPDYRITIDGEALYPRMMTPTPPVKATDLADAKAKAAALQKQHD